MTYRFTDRTEAGQEVAKRLSHLAKTPDLIVLALPRGGVPVAFEVAKVLQVPLDIFLVRKLGAPGNEELAIGAIAENDTRFVNQELVQQLKLSDDAIEQIVQREQQELKRRKREYRGDRAAPDISNKTVIVVDDGLATGATMKAAIHALRTQQPTKIIVAVPVSATDTCNELRQLVDEVICVIMPEPFYAIGSWYRHFPQLSDADVVAMLQ